MIIFLHISTGVSLSRGNHAEKCSINIFSVLYLLGLLIWLKYKKQKEDTLWKPRSKTWIHRFTLTKK